MSHRRRSLRVAAHSEAFVLPTPPAAVRSRRSAVLRELTQLVESDDEGLILEEKSKPSQKILRTPTKQSSRGAHAGMNSATPRASIKRRGRSKADVPNSQSSGCSCSGDEKTALQATPPKQQKQQAPVTSPSALMKRLSIDDRTQVATGTEADEVGSKKKVNKYQQARRVLNSTETNHLPGREAQLKTLCDFFTQHLDEQRSGSLYVSGQPGTGKTACLSMLLRSPEYAQRLQRVYINCTSIASVHSVYKKICSELKLKLDGQTEADCLKAIQRYLRKSKRMLLLVLDEIDQLCNAKQSVLYTIFEWPAVPNAKILLVGIANCLDLTDRTLTRLNAHCELKPQLLHFPPYTKAQIVEIFKSRLAEADVLDVFPPVTLQLLAAKVSAVNGDVRRALDIGRRVVELAEQQKRQGGQEFDLQKLDTEESLKPVQVAQVAAVLNTVYGGSQNLDDDIESSFPLQQKLLLCALMLILRHERSKDVSISRLHEVYRRVCEKHNIQPLDHSEFVGNVDLVETRGILRIMRKKEQRLNKVVLQWDEEEVHAALCDKQLIASIITDTTCLKSQFR